MKIQFLQTEITHYIFTRTCYQKNTHTKIIQIKNTHYSICKPVVLCFIFPLFVQCVFVSVYVYWKWRTDTYTKAVLKEEVMIVLFSLCYGASCNSTCPDHRYGLNCSSECDCGEDVTCTPATGTCPHSMLLGACASMLFFMTCIVCVYMCVCASVCLH